MFNFVQAIEDMYDSVEELRKLEFELHAVMVHEGSIDSGHYWAYVRDHARKVDRPKVRAHLINLIFDKRTVNIQNPNVQISDVWQIICMPNDSVFRHVQKLNKIIFWNKKMVQNRFCSVFELFGQTE